MVNPIPKFVEKIWSKWNIRAVILLSLFLQIVLIFLAPLRKRTRKWLLTIVLWSTYLLADYAADFCVGLISNKYGNQSTSITNINDFLLAFWAPFLLLHLGGPDTITAFSLEDNELWLRHMLSLIVQVCLTGYVFLLTLPANTMWVPTILVFIGGIIKFGEKTRSLQLASIDNFRGSITNVPQPGPNYAKLMEEYKSRKDAGLPTKIVTMPEPEVDAVEGNKNSSSSINDNKNYKDSVDEHKKEILEDVDVVRDAHDQFNTFKGLIVDMILDFHTRKKSRNYFLGLTAVDALRVIEVELNFIYGAFYTKAMVVRSKVGYVFRFVSVSSVVAALVLFFLDKKNGCDEFDVIVTYTLLYGAVALDFIALLMFILSDDTVASIQKKGRFNGIRAFQVFIFKFFLKLKRPTWPENKVGKRLLFTILLSKFQALCRRWSGSISGFNLLAHTLNTIECSWTDKVIGYIGATEIVEQWKYNEEHQPLFQEFWIFIFKELERKSWDADDVETIQRICSSRGEWVIQEGEIERDDIDKLMPYVDANIITFDQSIILWHIATDILFCGEENKDVEEGNNGGSSSNSTTTSEFYHFDYRHLSKVLSDYMIYLIIMQPAMMSAVIGIGQRRFKDTCAEATKFFEERDVIIMADRDNEGKKNAIFSKLNDSSFWKKMLNEFSMRLRRGKEREKEKRNQQQKEACIKLIDVCTEQEPSSVKGDRSKSVLFDACRLANELKSLKEKNKWKIIAQVWVELLSYAACNCRPITHVQQLSKGGEFISLVWLLMTHLGLAKQFQIQEGHARAKLIVGE